MKKLRPISLRRLPPPKSTEIPSTAPRLAKTLRLEPLRSTWPKENQPRLLTGTLRTSSPRRQRILDWDLECVAAGFGDPSFVPTKVTVIAWSWVGEDHVSWATRLEDADAMFSRFLDAYNEADVVTGHNLIRFDLPVLQADLLRHGFPKLKPVLVQDTIRIVKTKGFKKGQDNLSALLANPIQKMPLNWQEWQDAYEESDWATVVERCVSDVKGHKILRERMLDLGWLRPAVMWKP